MPTGAGCFTQRTRAYVPYTPYTSVLKFAPPAGRVCGAATHAVGGDAGYACYICNAVIQKHIPAINESGVITYFSFLLFEIMFIIAFKDR